jgi:hypothetical protein
MPPAMLRQISSSKDFSLGCCAAVKLNFRRFKRVLLKLPTANSVINEYGE